MNKTPRTKAARDSVKGSKWNAYDVLDSHEQLECELNEAREVVKSLITYHPLHSYTPREIARKRLLDNSFNYPCDTIEKARAIIKS